MCALSLAVSISADTGFLINDDNGNPIQPQIQSEPPLRQLTEEKPPQYPQQQGVLPVMSEAEMIKMIKEEADGPRYRDWETDRKSTRLNSSHITRSRMPSSA